MLVKLKEILFKWLPVGLWCGVIFYLSAMPATRASSNPLLDHLLHDLAHIIEYGILLGLLIRALGENLIRLPKLSFVLLLLYAISDEIHQYFVATRSAKLEDIFFDLSGGLLAWQFLQRIQQQRQKS